MKFWQHTIFILITAMISITLSGQDAKDLSLKITETKLSSKEDSLTYAIAVFSFNSWIKENISPDPIIFAKALIDEKNGNPLMSIEIARSFIMSYMNERETKQAEQEKVKYKDYIAENEAFLAKNKEKPGIITTASGLQYEVVRLGTGPKPSRDNTVKVHYTGRLIDGTEFDSSIKRNSPAQFPLSGVIPGWTEALQLMPTGSKFILYVPSGLAYGSKGAGDVIKPFSTLIFEVELLEIVK